MTLAQALFLAVLQGVSELFPISSLGHTILVPAVLGWHNIDRTDPTFLAFVVVLHLGTAIALLVFYRDEWIAIVKALVASVARGKLDPANREESIGWHPRRDPRGPGAASLRVAGRRGGVSGGERRHHVSG